MRNSDSQDNSSKTEHPTQKRLDEALKRGHVAFSRDLTQFISITLIALFTILFMPQVIRKAYLSLYTYIEYGVSHANHDMSKSTLKAILIRAFSDYAKFASLPLALCFLAPIISGLLQNGFIFNFGALRFDLSRISILAGIKRLFSINSIIELLKGLAKTIVMILSCYIAIFQTLPVLYRVQEYSLQGMFSILFDTVSNIAIAGVIVMFIFGIIDLIYQKYKYTKNLMMTRQEVLDEAKETEGRPEVKSRVKSIRMERYKKHMLAALKNADVVITNPTHYAVALEYDVTIMPAPKVVAKGVDHMAMRIKELAHQYKIEIIENPEVARLIYNTVKLDEYIKPESYEIVARVIYGILKARGKL